MGTAERSRSADRTEVWNALLSRDGRGQAGRRRAPMVGPEGSLDGFTDRVGGVGGVEKSRQVTMQERDWQTAATLRIPFGGCENAHVARCVRSTRTR